MIKMLRVDHRLLHGQVAVSWKSALDVDCILVANDSVPGDALRKSAIKLAKPADTKLVIKTIDYRHQQRQDRQVQALHRRRVHRRCRSPLP